MAALIVAGIEAVAAAIGTEMVFTAGQLTMMANGALLVGGLAYSANRQRQAQDAARQAYNASQVDRLRSIHTTVSPRRLVMGRVRESGALFYRNVTGGQSQVLFVAVALASHEIDGVEKWYLNDQEVTIDGNGWVQQAPFAAVNRISAITTTGGPYAGTPIPGTIAQVVEYNDSGVPGPTGMETYQYDEFSSYVNLQLHTGAAGQAVDANLQANFPADFGTSDVVQGVAYVVMRCQYTETAFPTGVPALSVLMRGAKVYDPRSSTTVFSTNPALMMRHVYTHADFGKSAVTAAEDARIIAAANACDTSTSYNVNGTTQTNPLYRAGLVAEFGTTASSLFDDLAQAMGGSWAFAGGEMYLKAGVYTAPVLALAEADIAFDADTSGGGGAIQVAVHKEQRSKFNTVTAPIWDADINSKQITHTLQSAALLARDGMELVQQVAMPAIYYAPQALHVAGVMMRDARDPLTITIPFKMSAYALEVFDTFTLTVARYGWTAKEFQVLSRSWAPGGAVTITAKETGAAIFTLDGTFSPVGLAGNTVLHAPWDVGNVDNLTLASGTAELQTLSDGTVRSRLRVSWSTVADAAVLADGQVQVQYKLATGEGIEGPWQQVTVPGTETQVYITDVQDGQNYLVRARARTTVGVGQWCLQQTHRVLGKTEPPSDVITFTLDGLRLSWSAVADADLAGYELRYQFGSNPWWDSANPLHAGLVTAAPYVLSQAPQGHVTFLIKAVDTSGNRSANAAAVLANLGDADISNIVLSLPEAPTFASGTLTGGTVTGGELLATANDRFFEPADEPLFSPGADLMFAGGTYETMVYTWPVMVTAPGTLYLESVVEGISYGVEYQRGSQEPMFTPGADLMFSPAGDLMFGAAPEWQAWPGSLNFAAGEFVTLRITVAGGDVQGVVSTLTVLLDVPDIRETLDNIVISSGGTRLPLSNTYTHIVTVLMNVQADGNGGISARIEDKNPSLGPLVTVRNDAGVAVTGLLDAQITGYRA